MSFRRSGECADAPERSEISALPRGRAALRLGLALPAVALLALGCSAEMASYSTDAATGSTHALISIQRSASADGQTAARAGAVAGFVRMPADIDADSVLSLVGLGLQLPAPGTCTRRLTPSDPSLPMSSMGHVELLEAGDVSLDAANATTTLAPRAFPTITDRISGVLYTTRDRSADPLPASVRYTVRTSGGVNVEPLMVSTEAPALFSNVTVGGVPLGDVGTIRTSQPLDFDWTGRSAEDLVYVELSKSDGSAGAICTFHDAAGSGTVPAGTLDALGAGRVAVHRLRTREFSSAGIDSGELRFDFELAQNVTFGQ